jgi:hypothetical protein
VRTEEKENMIASMGYRKRSEMSNDLPLLHRRWYAYDF